jgi:hypothetical protein
VMNFNKQSSHANKPTSQCHRRKVKCIPTSASTSPCYNCVSANLQCTFYNKAQKKGPKGSRSKVITEIRDSQQQVLKLEPKPISSGFSRGFRSPLGSKYVPSSLNLQRRTGGLLSCSLINGCIEWHFANIYAWQPVLDPAFVESVVKRMDGGCDESYCLIAALCALVLLQSRTLLSPALRALVESEQLDNGELAPSLLNEGL